MRNRFWRYATVGLLAAGGVVALVTLGPWRAEPASVTVVHPLDRAVFPADIVAPKVRWTASGDVGAWRVSVTFADGRESLTARTAEGAWTPSEEQWEQVKRRSVEQEATIAVAGLRTASSETVVCEDRVRIRTSPDPVGAPLMYREVNLPFIEAVTDPTRIRWRYGQVGARQAPIVLQNLPVCGNCHSFSADGSVMGMDVDYANDKGSYAIAQVQPRMVLDKRNIITWSDYKRADGEQTFGLLSQVSPDGRYVVSTVKDRSVFVPKPGLMYSQLFFPIKGILAVYSRETKQFRALAGADDKRYVQSNAAWRPDGRTLVFTRSRAYELKGVGSKVLLTEEDCREFLKEGKTFLFDLYTVPFNDGAGGEATPLAGASDNGMSNYFPKYSPDGRWIVFCKARSFSLLQPDSQLYIVPASGGEARRLACNLDGMNSWHSWSPNGRWLVFSSKHNGPYTQLWLTHIDAQGRSTRPVVLDHLTAPDRAANIPEFVNAPTTAIARIRGEFLDDYSFRRAGEEFLKADDLANAERMFRKAVTLNPANAEAQNNLAVVLDRTDRDKEAMHHYEQAVRRQPDMTDAMVNLAPKLMRYGRADEAEKLLRDVVRLTPNDAEAHFWLARLLSKRRSWKEALEHYQRAARLGFDRPELGGELAEALVDAGRPADAIVAYRRVLEQRPDDIRALVGLAFVLATTHAPLLRNGPDAVRLATRACAQTKRRAPGPLNALAAAYAETGRFDQAVRVASEALAAARSARNPNLIRQTTALLEMYKSGQPLRAAPTAPAKPAPKSPLR